MESVSCFFERAKGGCAVKYANLCREFGYNCFCYIIINKYVSDIGYNVNSFCNFYVIRSGYDIFNERLAVK